MYVLTNPSSRARCDTRSIFTLSLADFNSVFLLLDRLPYCLSIVGERIIRFKPFARILTWYEMQIVSSRSWTRFVVSIFYNDNHLTSSTSTCMYVSIYVCMSVSVSECVCVSVSVNMCLCVSACVCTHEYLYVYISMYVCMYVCICVCKFTQPPLPQTKSEARSIYLSSIKRSEFRQVA